MKPFSLYRISRLISQLGFFPGQLSGVTVIFCEFQNSLLHLLDLEKTLKTHH